MSDEADYAGEARIRDEEALAARLERERLARESQVGTAECIDCEDEIPLRRRQALPWVRRCVTCQQLADLFDGPLRR
ncbi:TraR/DksA C4-type zinc finger protein [Spirulina subsalsa FACHB-351]|uniref:TraR/DksA C4-type zinc finger protein n=1 Tax=Spirulina subsalsa FACHB-351 TaxID=234711 RepID=A0ABT3L5L8_9CYAN|nr:TraR/DksA C4-type zinc finger protein [Spirulina subsalsa]MCW6036806.1 TraR/DksA C4-type zinc finger protein [Spirulina subsalsa FACHB-351]